MKNIWVRSLLFGLVLVVVVIAALVLSERRQATVSEEGFQKVVINEAVRTLLYLPLYHAEHRGFFREEGLDVQIVSAGSATASFASMLSGEADFSQADPMYVPISREKGSDAQVVAQVIARISLWAVASPEFEGEFDQEDVRGKTIATHPRPMTAYTYAVKALRSINLDPDQDVELLEVRPGGELAALLSGEADIAFTLEPGTSISEEKGARVLISFPDQLGDQVFTALMTSETKIKERPNVVHKVTRAYQRSLTEITNNPPLASETAKAYFPSVEKSVLDAAMARLVREKVYPESIRLPRNSWRRAVAERVEIGDLSGPYPYDSAVATEIVDQAIASLSTKTE